MYNNHFGFAEPPFSIAPDPRYLYLSEQHREALAHLVYGIGDHGGFVVLTGEVGTGKTTVCRCLLQQIPAHIDIAVIVNPKLDSHELLQTICDELGVALDEPAPTAKQLLDALNTFLLATHARGRNAILIVDEAQNLAPDVLEQLRLLTNLETNERKLLQLILLGQPELNTLLAQPSLRQLSQRITARYHLRPLGRDEVARYIEHRVAVAGGRGNLFTRPAISAIYRYSKGIPRLINLLCDRALLGVYAQSGSLVDAGMVRRAAREVMPRSPSWLAQAPFRHAAALAGVVAIAAALYWGWQYRGSVMAPLAAPVAAVPWSESLQAAEGGRAAALQDLAREWGIDPAATALTDACPQTRHSVSCLALQRLGEAELRRYNVPLVLVLRDAEGGERHAVLKRLRDARALLAFGGRDWDVAWDDVARLWQGDALLLAPAPVSQLPLQPGATDELVAWFDRQLYRHFHRDERRWQREVRDRSAQLEDGAPKAAFLTSHYLALREQPAGAVYDAALLADVKRFQAEQGLPGNGVIDLATLLALTRAGDAQGPALDRAAPRREG